ncbi:hypothetical protein F7725_015039 [Dissostichus mawsoni]|uniref:Uncharacterized protein n=1 Tax=Dissostichus mawsoni TaxID=36200 RepID=A0A7J5YGC2_DISMA|nr:hypothetical protein F7725_015039 [Dissostichus mawsoni]
MFTGSSDQREQDPKLETDPKNTRLPVLELRPRQHEEAFLLTYQPSTKQSADAVRRKKVCFLTIIIIIVVVVVAPLTSAPPSLQFLLVLPVRSLSHRPPELPANLPASSFTIPACPVLSPA